MKKAIVRIIVTGVMIMTVACQSATVEFKPGITYEQAASIVDKTAQGFLVVVDKAERPVTYGIPLHKVDAPPMDIPDDATGVRIHYDDFTQVGRALAEGSEHVSSVTTILDLIKASLVKLLRHK